MNRSKFLIIALVLGAVASFFAFGLNDYFSLSYFNTQKTQLFEFYQANPWLTIIAYVLIYIAVAGLSLPGAALMTLVGGAIFGFLLGSVLVSIASTIGATLAFLASRSVLRSWVQQRFGSRLQAVNSGIDKQGAYYLFGLRLVPVFPFFIVNLLMGLTTIKTRTYFIVSQLCMLPATLVYVNAGKQLASIDSVENIMSVSLLVSFALLALFPLVIKKVLAVINDRKVLSAFDKPSSFDANIIVIGAGSAGLVSSLIAATVNAKAILVERDKMGGDCLNTGCVPSKALLRSAKVNHYMQRADEFGIELPGEATVNFPKVMQRVQNIINTIEPHDSVERFEGLGVQCEQGRAKIISPWAVTVTDEHTQQSKTFTAANIIIASGARPFVPPIPGIETTEFYTSDTLWQIEDLPDRLTILGAGPIGCELAQAFARLGSKVTLVDMASRVLPREDEDASELLATALQADGIELLLDSKVVSAEAKALQLEVQGQSSRLAFDHLLVAVGRQANTDGLGLAELGVELNRNRTVSVDEYLRSSIPTIYACGDVAGPYQFTHTASHQAWYATVNALFGMFKKFKVDYSVIPWATFTDPEIAHVGINEREAAEQGIDVEVTRYDIGDLDRAIADSEARGFVKVMTKPKSDKILGVTIVGYHASEQLAEFVLAMRHGLGLKKVMATIHLYPTLAEANKFAASEWQKKHKPDQLLAWVAKYHAWRKG